MFVVLQPEERENTLLSRIADYLHPFEPQLIPIAVKGGAPFFIMNCPVKKGCGADISDTVSWQKIAASVGRCASRMLIPSWIEIPCDCGISRFVPKYLPHRIALNSAAAKLRSCQLSPAEITVGIADSLGILAGDIEQLVMLASTIIVVSNRRSKYEEVAVTIMEKYGAAIVIADDLSALSECNFIVTTDDRMIPPGTNCTVLCAQTDNPQFIHITDAELPFEYQKMLPYGIDALQFASALYELCGVRRMLDIVQHT